ncbi:MAG: hypothetical protein WDN04_17120 [Rhodospirillales bacterium]
MPVSTIGISETRTFSVTTGMGGAVAGTGAGVGCSLTRHATTPAKAAAATAATMIGACFIRLPPDGRSAALGAIIHICTAAAKIKKGQAGQSHLRMSLNEEQLKKVFASFFKKKFFFEKKNQKTFVH